MTQQLILNIFALLKLVKSLTYFYIEFDLSQCQRNQTANSDCQVFNAHSEVNPVWKKPMCIVYQCHLKNLTYFFQSAAVEPARRGTATGRVQGTDLQSMVHGMNGIVYLTSAGRSARILQISITVWIDNCLKQNGRLKLVYRSQGYLEVVYNSVT